MIEPSRPSPASAASAHKVPSMLSTEVSAPMTSAGLGTMQGCGGYDTRQIAHRMPNRIELHQEPGQVVVVPGNAQRSVDQPLQPAILIGRFNGRCQRRWDGGG